MMRVMRRRLLFIAQLSTNLFLTSSLRYMFADVALLLMDSSEWNSWA